MLSPGGKVSLQAGDQLKQIRARLRITTREVEEYSRKIADLEGNEEFYISNARLTEIERTHSTPSIYKLFSLSVIYRTKFTDLLLLYHVDLEKISKYRFATPLRRTHLATLEVYDKNRTVSFPVRFDPAFRAERTTLLSRMVQVWGEVPVALIQHLDFRHCLYGYIGLEDYTMYPLLRPGCFVQIDDRQTQVEKRAWQTEFDRPIYFVELRDGYACGWCDLDRDRLTLLPHPLSPCRIRQFSYPMGAELVGRVTAVAMRIVNPPKSPPGETPRLPSRS